MSRDGAEHPSIFFWPQNTIMSLPKITLRGTPRETIILVVYLSRLNSKIKKRTKNCAAKEKKRVSENGGGSWGKYCRGDSGE